MHVLSSITDQSLPVLERFFVEIGEKPFRAKQLFKWLYRKNVASFEEMTDIRKELRSCLARTFAMPVAEEWKRQTSTDGTLKFALKLKDNALIESVILFDEERRTLCLSTQVGCQRGCRICATAQMGFKRNLTQGEILQQIIHANRILGPERPIMNLVFMGMGEPMDNLDNVLAALAVIHSDHGFCISPKRITVSTVGILEGIERLAKEGNGEGLAISLHASTDEVRRKLVPAAKKSSIREILAASGVYARKIGEKITFEYVLIRGLNTLPEDGERLSVLLSRLPSKLNLIPCNTARDNTFQPPSEREIHAFLKPLLSSPVIITRRKTKGSDIAAACGQLCASEEL